MCVRKRSPSVFATLDGAGYQTEMTFSHWLGKVFQRTHYIDIIFSSGNGLCRVDDEWFEHALEGEIFGVSVRFCAPEEAIWSKAFILERERYDGADIAHLILAAAQQMDWCRLLRRFGDHWRVLLSHLVIFGFIYPGRVGQVPAWLLEEFGDGWFASQKTPPTSCRYAGEPCYRVPSISMT